MIALKGIYDGKKSFHLKAFLKIRNSKFLSPYWKNLKMMKR